MAHGWDAKDLDTLQKRRQTAQVPAGGDVSRETSKRAKGTKYRNKPVLVDFGPSGETVNGHLRLVHTFQSQREADHYQVCALRRKAGEIEELRLQEPFALRIYGVDGRPVHVGEWLADFVYQDQTGRHIVDAKGVRNAYYILKKKIVEAGHGITIEEV